MNKVLVLTYWSFEEPLIQKYTLPYLEVIKRKSDPGSEIHLVTFEKPWLNGLSQEKERKELEKKGIKWITFSYRAFGFWALFYWVGILKKLFTYCKEHSISTIHCWGTPVGSAGYILSKLSGIDLVLDSFEPHAEAMVENGEWKRYRLAFQLLFFFEKLQAKKAKYAIGVVDRMKEYSLRTYGTVPSNYLSKPACVDVDEMRELAEVHETGIKDIVADKVVGIYAGKIGGIYLEEEFFIFLSEAFNYWGNDFFFILLTDKSEELVKSWCNEYDIPWSQVHCKSVRSNEVPAYLKLADFAINPVKPVPSKRYCTSIKDAEYWSFGLPVIIPPDISIDSHLINELGIGVIVDPLDRKGFHNALVETSKLLDKEPPSKLEKRIEEVARRERSYQHAEQAYERIYNRNNRKGLRLAFICYWESGDFLTKATVLPHLRELAKREDVEKIDVYTIERGEYEFTWIDQIEKIGHYPTSPYSLPKGPGKKFKDLNRVWKNFKRNYKNDPYDQIYCRSSQAGIIGLWAKEKFNIPFMVESFEPHTEYMLDAGEWKKNSIKVRVLKRYENKEIQEASALLPVAENYSNRLRSDYNVEEDRVFTFPCTVPLEKFQFSSGSRKKIREELGLDEEYKVGIYVGKFGGIYYEKEAVKVFKEFFEILHSIGDKGYMVILSPTSKEKIENWFYEYGIGKENFFVGKVDHESIPQYLSAADLAFSLFKKFASNRYLSPIKNGEYWANGLPVVITDGVGDDSEIIHERMIGASIDPSSPESISEGMRKAVKLMSEEGIREKIKAIAQEKRSDAIIPQVYDRVIKKLNQEGRN